ncbi:unnamed protein product [Amoebophrya sp. A25]|nr:unnamed protein product [Amoebophrya sp. A25]|eukprot:GSA25T00018725001.1
MKSTVSGAAAHDAGVSKRCGARDEVHQDHGWASKVMWMLAEACHDYRSKYSHS